MPKVNLIGVIAGVLALVTIVLPWWSATGPLGFSANLTFFSLSGFSDQADQALSQIMLVVPGVKETIVWFKLTFGAPSA